MKWILASDRTPDEKYSGKTIVYQLLNNHYSEIEWFNNNDDKSLAKAAWYKWLDESLPEINQEEAWDQHLDELGNLCMYAPLHEPDRRNHLLKELSSKYILIKR